jgi:hypothetical protein
MQSYQDRMSAEAARQANIATQQEARRQDLEQMHLRDEQVKAADQAKRDEHSAFLQRVQATREAVARGEITPDTTSPRAQLNAHYREQAEQERQAKAQAEAARVAALTPREIWLTTLPFAEQQRVSVWERTNKMEWPYVPTK